MTTFKDLPSGAYFRVASAPGQLLQKCASRARKGGFLAIDDNYKIVQVLDDVACEMVHPQLVPQRNKNSMNSLEEE